MLVRVGGLGVLPCSVIGVLVVGRFAVEFRGLGLGFGVSQLSRTFSGG